MKRFLRLLLAAALCFSPSAGRADLFGGDVVVLAQILANAIQQLAQLKQIMDNGQDTLGLMRDINRGINDSLQLMQTSGLIKNPGVYKEWTQVDQALGAIGTIYGIAVPSQDQRSQMDTDRGIAEAVTLGNSVYEYTREVDDTNSTGLARTSTTPAYLSDSTGLGHHISSVGTLGNVGRELTSLLLGPVDRPLPLEQESLDNREHYCVTIRLRRIVVYTRRHA